MTPHDCCISSELKPKHSNIVTMCLRPQPPELLSISVKLALFAKKNKPENVGRTEPAYAKHISRHIWYWYLHYTSRRNFVKKSAYGHG